MNTQNINLTNVDEFEIGGKKLDSRLLIGTAMYDSPSIM